MLNPERAARPLGEIRAITEQDWFDALTATEPLHQWGPAFLVAEPTGDRVCVYVRDDSGQGRHACLRLDESASCRAREGVGIVEAAARRAADLITANQGKPSCTVADLAAEQEASQAYTDEADTLYRELLAGA